MPCSCEVFDPPIQNNLKHKELHTLHCSDQALILRMDRLAQACGVEWPPEFQDRITRARQRLLKHKKNEHHDDIKKLDSKIQSLENDIAKIEKLGGAPTPKKQEKLKLVKQERKELKAMTDREILGVD